MHMKIIPVILLILFFTTTRAQSTPDDIVTEGKILYALEMASWHGTDVFMEKLAPRRENLGGYFSYSGGNRHTCIFFSRSDTPQVLAAITFDDNFDPAQAAIDSAARTFTAQEQDIYLLRKATLAEINRDTVFRHYNNTNLNPIPLIGNGYRKAYVLTGPKVSGVVVFGNDYLLTFDKDNKVISTRQLHRNIIPIEYKKEDPSTATMHSHRPETGYHITATDICTLMLYAKYAGWEQHYVISEKFVSIWDCKKNELVTLTREAWEKISQHQRGKKQP